MTDRKPFHPIEECARRGDEWYESQIRPLVEQDNYGRIVAIDIKTGAYELGDSMTHACESLYARIPDAQTWCIRIGYPGVCHFGALALREKV